jgi:hypothetical protein
MKRSISAILLTLTVSILTAQQPVEVVTGANYGNDVYYSLENGIVREVARTNWEIGFSTSSFSISILANQGAGVEVYTYPSGDTADWATLDTTGMAWIPMYNSLETVEEGAFTANDLGHPDYGWGTYNMSTHFTTGDSLFVIRTVAGAWKKLAIIQKRGRTWEFKYASLDGSGEISEIINPADYISVASTNRFLYYSIDNQEVIEREPGVEAWDLLFTKYYDFTIPYSVSGILTNEDHILAQQVSQTGLDQATFVDFNEGDFTTDMHVIGSDWKQFNGQTFSYDLTDSTVFFLKQRSETDSAYYKIYFTGFTSGMADGKYTFVQEKLSRVPVEAHLEASLFDLYPNPAADHLRIVVDHTGQVGLDILDITGRTVLSGQYLTAGFTVLTVDVSSLIPGLHFIRLGLDGGAQPEVGRFVKE